jgi:hypothetical protein
LLLAAIDLKLLMWCFVESLVANVIIPVHKAYQQYAAKVGANDVHPSDKNRKTFQSVFNHVVDFIPEHQEAHIDETLLVAVAPPAPDPTKQQPINISTPASARLTEADLLE